MALMTSVNIEAEGAREAETEPKPKGRQIDSRGTEQQQKKRSGKAQTLLPIYIYIYIYLSILLTRKGSTVFISQGILSSIDHQKHAGKRTKSTMLLHRVHPLTVPQLQAKPVLFLYEACLLDLGVEELLQQIGTLVVLTLGRVILATVGKDALHVGHEKLARGVVPALQPLCHGLQI